MIRRFLLGLGLAALLLGWTYPGTCAAQGKEEQKPPAKPVIPVFRLAGEVTEESTEEGFSLSVSHNITLRDLVQHMRKAIKDPAVKAVVLLNDGGSVGHAKIEELRQVMAQLRKAGKEVYSHSDSLDMSDYALLSGATRLSVVPTGDLWVLGIRGESPYIRGLLDLLGVKPDFLTCGDFKSAAEIFMRDGPSPQAEKMQNWLLDSMYETFVDLIAKGRNVPVEKVKKWVDEGPYTAERAQAQGLIDAVEHRQDFEKHLRAKYGQNVVFDRKYGKKQAPKLDFSSPFALFKIMGDMMGEGQKKKSTKSAIGIVYVDGAIDIGGGAPSPFSAGGAHSTAIRKALDDAAKDEAIKAVVLRIDSPGGSAVASEIILDATRRVKAKKPFVVSMGDVAGSGGYYVACAADVIFADETTITGSIGVVGGKLATNAMWKKIGITFKEYKRGQNADLLSSADVFTPGQRERLQKWMDEIYSTFKGHVVAIRGSRLKKPIDELAGGRVYTGKQALELGLVDRIGSLQDAIEFAASQAKITDYDVRVVPEPKNFLETLLEELSGEKDEPNRVIGLRGQSLVALALPHLQHLDPRRARLIIQALRRLELLQRDGAVLMMPEVGRIR